jgi:hypothetical protein
MWRSPGNSTCPGQSGESGLLRRSGRESQMSPFTYLLGDGRPGRWCSYRTSGAALLHLWQPQELDARPIVD